MNTEPGNRPGDEPLDESGFITKAFLYAQKTFETDPDFSEQMHNEVVRTAMSPEELEKIHRVTRVMMLNYLKTATWNRAEKRGQIEIDKNGGQYVPKKHFQNEYAAMQALSQTTIYSVNFADAFAAIGEKIADVLPLYYEMSEFQAFFPYMNEDQKLDFAHFYGAAFTKFTEETFDLTLNQPYFFKVDSEKNKTLAFAVPIDINGVKTPIIGITALGMSLKTMPEFCETLQHELVHQFIMQLGLQHQEDYVFPTDSKYRYDFMIVAAKGFNKGISNAVYPELYEGDSEEFICNYAGLTVYRRLSTFTPSCQITHQPLLEIK